MTAIEQLERLRREAVERARVAVLAARGALQQAERLREAAVLGERTLAGQLTRARHAFADAKSVLDLRAAEAQLTDARARHAAQCDVAQRAQRTWAEARARLAACERALLEAELGRRAVERRLGQRAADVGRRTEGRREEEADDAFRSHRARGSA